MPLPDELSAQENSVETNDYSSYTLSCKPKFLGRRCRKKGSLHLNRDLISYRVLALKQDSNKQEEYPFLIQSIEHELGVGEPENIAQTTQSDDQIENNNDQSTLLLEPIDEKSTEVITSSSNIASIDQTFGSTNDQPLLACLSELETEPNKSSCLEESKKTQQQDSIIQDQPRCSRTTIVEFTNAPEFISPIKYSCPDSHTDILDSSDIESETENNQQSTDFKMGGPRKKLKKSVKLRFQFSFIKLIFVLVELQASTDHTVPCKTGQQS